MVDIRLEDAVELVAGKPDAPVVISCEHASERLPEPWEWPMADRWLVGTHWAYDIGASDLSRDLAQALGAPAVMARFSRLLVDPNRPFDSPTLFRDQAEGHPVEMNRGLTAADRQQRMERLYLPYHTALDRVVGETRGAMVVAAHTFTPVYEGEPRTLEVGVLYDQDEELAQRVLAAIAATGMRVALNEPYSGKAGMMYAADRHARAHNRRTVELEVRQDLAVEAVVRRQLVTALQSVFG